jgi:hypothetical protein
MKPKSATPGEALTNNPKSQRSLDESLCVSLVDFLRTGLFGPVVLGATTDVVQGLIGADSSVVDEYRSEFRNSRGRIKGWVWKFGDIEFHFDSEEVLWLIHADDFKQPTAIPPIELDPGWVHGGQGFEQITELLNKDAIAWREARSLDDHSRRIQLDSGVHLTFAEKDGLSSWSGLFSVSISTGDY